MFLGLKHNTKKASLMGKKWSPPPAEADSDEANAVESELDALDKVSAARAAKWQNNQGKLKSSVTGLVSATKKLQKVAIEKVESKQLPDEFSDINLNPGAKNPFKKKKVKRYSENEDGEMIETFHDMEGDLEHDKQDVHLAEANAQNAYELAKKARDFALEKATDNKNEKVDIKAV